MAQVVGCAENSVTKGVIYQIVNFFRHVSMHLIVSFDFDIFEIKS